MILDQLRAFTTARAPTPPRVVSYAALFSPISSSLSPLNIIALCRATRCYAPHPPPPPLPAHQHNAAILPLPRQRTIISQREISDEHSASSPVKHLRRVNRLVRFLRYDGAGEAERLICYIEGGWRQGVAAAARQRRTYRRGTTTAALFPNVTVDVNASDAVLSPALVRVGVGNPYDRVAKQTWVSRTLAMSIINA